MSSAAVAARRIPTADADLAFRPGDVMSKEHFFQRAGLKRAAFRDIRTKCEEQGILIERWDGNRCYVEIDGWLEYLRKCGQSKAASDSTRS